MSTLLPHCAVASLANTTHDGGHKITGRQREAGSTANAHCAWAGCMRCREGMGARSTDSERLWFAPTAWRARARSKRGSKGNYALRCEFAPCYSELIVIILLFTKPDPACYYLLISIRNLILPPLQTDNTTQGTHIATKAVHSSYSECDAVTPCICAAPCLPQSLH